MLAILARRVVHPFAHGGCVIVDGRNKRYEAPHQCPGMPTLPSFQAKVVVLVWPAYCKRSAAAL